MRNILNLKRFSIQKGLSILTVNILCFIFTKSTSTLDFLNQYLQKVNRGKLNSMNLSSMFLQCLVSPRKIQQQRKETFFSVKKNKRKMKVSTCFTQLHGQRQKVAVQLENSSASLQLSASQRKDRNQLQSTFGEDKIISFTSKPRKNTKNNKRIFTFSGIKQRTPKHSSDILEQLLTPVKTYTKKQLYKQYQAIYMENLQPVCEKIKINDFIVLEQIGEGTYSLVFKAVHKKTGFLCALKILEKQKMREMKVEQNVVRQLKINSFVDHPNIAKLYSFFQDQHCIFLICQYATSQNLYQFQKEVNPQNLSDDSVKEIVSGICSAVMFLHDNSVIHRDIKPQNILLTIGNTVKLCDFGWSIYNPTKELRSTMCGTPLYLSPEMVQQQQYNESIDIWALGIITYELLVQENPFNIMQLSELQKIIYQQVDFNLIKNVHGQDFIKKTLIKDLNNRTSIYELWNHPFLRVK